MKMKNKWWKIVTVVMVLGAILGGILPNKEVQGASKYYLKYNGEKTVYSGPKIAYVIDGKTKSYNTPGIQIAGTNFVGAKDFFQKALGGTYQYTSKTGKILITYNGTKVEMTLGSKDASVDGTAATLSVAPMKVYFYSTKTWKIYVPVRFLAEESFHLDYQWNSSKKTVSVSSNKGLRLYYDGEWVNYTGTKATVNVFGTSLSSGNLPGIVIDKSTVVRAKKVFASSKIAADYYYDSASKTLTLSKGENTLVFQMGKKTCEVNGKTETMPTAARVVKTQGTSYICVPVAFTARALGYDYRWSSSKKTGYITAKEEETPVANTGDEFRGVWVSFLEFPNGKYSESAFTARMSEIVDKVAQMNMNAIVFQVRPFGDALYQSDYFPWSNLLTGTQGKDPGYDPLKIAIQLAHAKGLELHAWINPYRVTNGNEVEYDDLSANNQAYIWSNDTKTARNVLLFGGKHYYNPASPAVQELILNGVKEIVTNYQVDGIHLDDYFYPSLGTNYKSSFDATEYEASNVSTSIEVWRRNNVNTLVSNMYSAVKAIDPSCAFGISPAGNITNLYSVSGNYVDVKTWCANPGYIDYICPQVYWGFTHSTAAFDTVTDQWIALCKEPSVKLYLGIAVYKAGETLTGNSDATEWKSAGNVLRKQIEYGRNTKSVSGYVFFRYDSFLRSNQKTEVNELLKVLE